MAESDPARTLDAVPPPEMAARAEDVGVKKARLPADTTLVLAVLAGAFIGLGALFSVTATTGLAGALPYGLVRVVAGLTFTLGLILVVVGGAELFTGNTLIVMAWMDRKVSASQLLRNWALVYVGNFAGALATAWLVHQSGQPRFAGGAVATTLLGAAGTKLGYGFGQAIVLGILCNGLVCLAVWLTLSARSTADRILAIVPPITAFVALGFEHSVANMFLIPLALLEQAPGGTLSWGAFFIDNLLPVTLGNIVGGGGLVGLVYWFVYLRRR